jgi:hypothetical protein
VDAWDLPRTQSCSVPPVSTRNIARIDSVDVFAEAVVWSREDDRDNAIDDLIEVIVKFDGILQLQADADADYFLDNCERDFGEENIRRLKETVLAAYRWQYIKSGVQHPRFQEILSGMISELQKDHIQTGLAPILH